MSSPTAKPVDALFNPIRLEQRSLPWQLLAVVIGCALLTLSSYIEVPMIPVPMTMQTYVVVVLGALYGWRLGALTVMAWLGQAAVGLPVLAGGSGGAAAFIGPTAGYLVAFPLAAALTGWLAARGWNGQRSAWAFLSMLLGHALCLFLGALWLTQLIGLEAAITGGVVPFLSGAVLKSALAAVTLKAIGRGPKPTHPS
ncbi:MAG: biotin transporter BioY [Pseudomonadota bacterium]